MATHGKLRFYQYPAAYLRFLWVLVTVHYSIIPHIIVLAFLQPLRLIAPKIYLKIESWLFNFLLAVAASWIATCGHRSKCSNSLSFNFCLF